MQKSDVALAKIERANRIILWVIMITMFVLIAMGYYGIKEIQHNTVWQSEQNEHLIRELTNETNKQHAEQLDFVKCITFVPQTERPEGLNKCFK